MTPRFPRSDRWTAAHVVGAVLMAALGVAVTWPAWAGHLPDPPRRTRSRTTSCSCRWSAVWMLWARRMRFRYCRPSDTALGPLIVLLGLGAAVGRVLRPASRASGTPGPWWSSSGASCRCWASTRSSASCRVVAVLVFLVPVPGEIRLRIALPLQNWTAHIEQVIFDVFGADVVQFGNQLWYNGRPVDINREVQRPADGLRPDPGHLRLRLQFAAEELGPPGHPGPEPGGGHRLQPGPHPADRVVLRRRPRSATTSPTPFTSTVGGSCSASPCCCCWASCGSCGGR